MDSQLTAYSPRSAKRNFQCLVLSFVAVFALLCWILTEKASNIPSYHRVQQIQEVRTERRLCQGANEYIHGEWIRNNSINAYPYLSTSDDEWGPLCMEMQNRYLESGIVPDFLKYQWRPYTCDILPFSRENFCEALDGLTIGTIGDSIMQQFAHSFMGRLLGEVDSLPYVYGEPEWFNNVPYYAKVRVPLCPDTAHNATLLFHRWNKYQPNPSNRQALIDIARESDYLILNWGVHYLPWREMEEATDDFISILEQHWRNKKSERIFWRSTIVAHDNCQNATLPDKSTGQFETHKNPNYNTDEILLQDEFIVRPRFQQSRLNVTFLRVEQSTMLRKDGHRVVGHKGTEDCLHYCEPGPTDSWVDLFHHHVLGLGV